MIIVELLCHVSSHLVDLINLLLLKLLHQLKRRFLIISHVFIPRISKLGILQFLSIFNIDQLSLLCNPHVVILSRLFIAAPTVEDAFEFVGHHVVAYGLITLPHLVHDLEEGHDPLIWQEVDARFWQEGPVLFFVTFED